MTEKTRRLRNAMRSLRRVLTGRSLWCCLLAVWLASVILYITQQTKTVYIQDGDTTQLYYTLKEEPEKILTENRIATMAFDVVDFSGFEGKMGVINIKRAFPVTLQVDGSERALMTPEVTIEQLLREQNIQLGEYDTVSPDPYLYVSPGDRIVIRRVQVRTTEVEETIPYETAYKQSSLVAAGRSRVLSQGQPGRRRLSYIDRIVDGVLQDRELAEVEILREPVEQVVLKGGADPVSKLDFGVALDAHGVPLSYKEKLSNQVCTGYSAPPGSYGASLMKLHNGYVAVRADEIPYGTKMYIKSADNSFVYGFAIAADTGIGLMGDAIDFDLFYETYTESCLNGRKNLDVYILG